MIDWFGLSVSAARLSIESQAVIGLRLMRLAAGGAHAEAEAVRMFSEKAAAMVEAQFDLARGLMTGRAHLGPKRTLALYRKRVRANRRRLSHHG
jgi:hypothetical protein